MAEDQHAENHESLGQYLRRLRIEQNLSFEEFQNKTKIPPKSLRAIEEDNHEDLPADAFARGFYMLYARCLQISTAEVLERFDREHKVQTTNKFPTPLNQEKQVNTMAARPSMLTGATLGFVLVVIIAAIGVLSWYFSWNPATFISSKIQSYQTQTTDANDGIVNRDLSKTGEKAQEGVVATNYFLTVNFLEDTTITIALDNGLPEQEVYTKGSTRSWYANEKISLILPESAKVELYFNGNQLNLPQSRGGVITLTLP